jgi:hypothetical protein
MKRYTIIIITAALFLLQGCMTEDSVSPVFYAESQNNSISWLEGTPVLGKEVIVEQVVNGKTGGLINYDLQIANLDVTGTLVIPKNSFDGSLNLTTSFSSRTTTQTFGPSPLDFRRPLILTLEYSGVNLSGINPNEIDFYYLGTDGQFYKAEYSSISVDPATGILKVFDAKLNHFSRWGWAKSLPD